VRRIVWPLLLAMGLLSGLAACAGEEPADFGASPGAEAPELPSDRGLDLGAVDEAGAVPTDDAVLEDATWPEVAAWIRRENDAGRPVVVNFFASWCGPCERELPLLIETAEAATDVTFLGINHVDQRPNAEEMVEEYGIPFPTLRDAPGDVVAEVGGRGLPHTVAFDTDGRLVSRVFGELTETNLEGLLSEVR
jgi:thiol-disulfide isomerase/thioredoxin